MSYPGRWLWVHAGLYSRGAVCCMFLLPTLALKLAGGSGTVVSSRSERKVVVASQPVAGPDPFTVSAEIFT
jgi:hypothetical protein